MRGSLVWLLRAQILKPNCLGSNQEKHLNFLHLNFLIYKNGDDNNANFMARTIHVHQVSSALLIYASR